MAPLGLSQESWLLKLPEGADWKEWYGQPGGLLARAPRWSLLLLRGILLVGWMSVIIWSFAFFVNHNHFHFPYWFIYLTHWGAGLELIYFMLLFATTCLAHCGPSSRNSIILILVKVTWCFAAIMRAVPLVIVIFFWLFIYPSQKHGVQAIEVALHGFNYVTLIFDVFSTSLPVHLKHVWIPIVTGFLYVTFSLVYYAAGGTGPSGEHRWIYEVLDWSNPEKAAFVCALALIAAAGIYVLHWLVSKLLQKLSPNAEKTSSSQNGQEIAADQRESLSGSSGRGAVRQVHLQLPCSVCNATGVVAES